jgi:translocator protein
VKPLRVNAQPPEGRWAAAIIIAVLVLAAALLGARASITARDFYAQLAKPSWAPPAGVFGPVWSTLYALMAIAAWLVWRARGSWQAAAVPLNLFILQLALNTLWSWLFFSWHQGALAVIEVGLLWLAILVTLVNFWQVRRTAGLLLLPYLLWVSFATALTTAVWRLNPTLL